MLYEGIHFTDLSLYKTKHPDCLTLKMKHKTKLFYLVLKLLDFRGIQFVVYETDTEKRIKLMKQSPNMNSEELVNSLTTC